MIWHVLTVCEVLSSIPRTSKQAKCTVRLGVALYLFTESFFFIVSKRKVSLNHMKKYFVIIKDFKLCNPHKLYCYTTGRTVGLLAMSLPQTQE